MALRHRLCLMPAVAILLGACADTGGPAVKPTGGTPAPPAGLVLRIQRGGGLAGPAVAAGEIPLLSAYADGRLITPGPQIAIYPPPALPSVQVQQFAADAVARLAADAVTAGVRPGTDFGDPRVADATTTTVIAATPNETHRVDVPALSATQPGDPDLTEAQQAARADLRAFVDRATRLPTSPQAPPARPYRPTTLAVLAVPAVAVDDLPSRPAVRPWPGPPLPGDDLPGAPQVGCTIVTGVQVDQLRAAAANASVLTPWRSGNRTWNVTFRPLLPDERTCADLPRHR